MQYPLDLSFKILAIAPQIFVRDANGQDICYIKQKLFKFKEKIEVFKDKSKSDLLATIQANKVIDWSARYFFNTADGQDTGSVGRRGAKSLLKAHYDVFNPGSEKAAFTIQEENPWAKVGDAIFGGIPLVGILSGYLFNPRYIAKRADGTPVMRLSKKRAFLESKFVLDKLDNLSEQEELTLVFSFVMLNLLERQRG